MTRPPAIVDEWIQLVEIPAPSGKEQARAQYIRAEMQKLGLSDIRVDDMLERERRSQGHGRRSDGCVRRAYGYRVSRRHRSEGQARGRHPARARHRRRHVEPDGHARDVPRAESRRRADQRRSGLPRDRAGRSWACSARSTGWRRAATSRTCSWPSMSAPTDVWYGALRINQFKFFYTSPGAHTLESRDGPSPAKAVARAIEALYDIPLPPVAEGLGTFKLPVLNVGMIGGGTVVNAVPREAWFTVDLRSLDTATQDRLEVASSTPRAGCRAGRRRVPDGKADGHRLLEGPAAAGTARTIHWCRRRSRRNHFRKPGTPAIVPADVGSTDANIAVSMGIPAVAIGADRRTHAASPRRVRGCQQHRAGHQVADCAGGGARPATDWLS